MGHRSTTEATQPSWLIGFIVCAGLLLAPMTVWATITLPWSTTYNCPELEEGTSPWIGGGADLGCDGIQSFGEWTANGQGEQITTDANNPSGGGVRGQRQWVCDGSNCNSGSTIVFFTAAQSEFYIRWYMRYQLGFAWNTLAYDKLLYIRDGVEAVIINMYETDGLRMLNDHDQINSPICLPGCGHQTIMGGSTGDGQWHWYEVHLKEDTNGANGIAQMWVDGVLRIDRADVNFGAKVGWTSIEIGENQATPANGANVYTDFDDIAIQTTGPIGGTSGGGGLNAILSPAMWIASLGGIMNMMESFVWPFLSMAAALCFSILVWELRGMVKYGWLVAKAAFLWIRLYSHSILLRLGWRLLSMPTPIEIPPKKSFDKTTIHMSVKAERED